MPAGTLEELADVSIESCLVMDWSPDLHKCFEAVEDINGMTSCQTMLMTSEQSDDLNRRWIDVVSRRSQQMQPVVP